MPGLGKDSESVNLLIQMTNCPFEKEQMVGLDILANLSGFTWGCRALYANEIAKKFIFERVTSALDICQKKYRLVTESIKTSASTAGLLNEETLG